MKEQIVEEMEDIWSSDKRRRFEEDYNKAFEPYEKMGFKPMSDNSLVLLKILVIALIPAIIGFISFLHLNNYI